MGPSSSASRPRSRPAGRDDTRESGESGIQCWCRRDWADPAPASSPRLEPGPHDLQEGVHVRLVVVDVGGDPDAADPGRVADRHGDVAGEEIVAQGEIVLARASPEDGEAGPML